MKITEIAIKRPVFTIVVYLAITAFGLVALRKLPLDLYPEIESPIISVVTMYPYASSWDVEEKVTKVIEKALSVQPGLKEITSKTTEGVSVVFLRYTFDTNLDEAAADARNALDFVARELPEGAEKPMLLKFNTAYFPVYFAALVSDEHDVTKLGTYIDDQIVKPLQSLDGVGAVQVFHSAEDVVYVDLRLEDMEKRGIPVDLVTRRLAEENISMPAGKIEDKDFELVLRAPQEFRTVDEIRDVIIQITPAGAVYLKDVADVSLSHKEFQNIADLDGSSVSVLMVQKRSQANTVEVVRRVKTKIEELQNHLGMGIKVIHIFDAATFIEDMLKNLYRSLALGGVLVVFVVIAFLRRLRASTIVAISIPGSMIIAFLMLYLKGYTLNAVSLMAMTLAVGMVVDNSIVVLENIARNVEWGKDAKEAALVGTKEVSLAILASTTTTIGIFLPMIFITGIVSILFGQLAYVIVVTLGASLVTSVFLTPMLASRLLTAKEHTKDVLRKVESFYEKILRYALSHKIKTFVVCLLVFVVSLLSLLRVGFDFLPVFDTGEVRATIELPVGTSLKRASEVAKEIASRIQKIPELVRLYTQAGQSESGFGVAFGQNEGSHIIQMHMQFLTVDKRKRGIKEIAEDVRHAIMEQKGVVSLDVNFGDQGVASMLGVKPFVVEVLGSDYGRLKEAAKEVERIVQSIDGTRDVASEAPFEKPETHLLLDRFKMARLGVSAFSASQAIKTSLAGTTVTRFRGTGKDIEVIVRLRTQDRTDVNKVLRLQVSSLRGEPVALKNMVETKMGFAPVTIEHSSLLRVIRIGANLANTSLGEASRAFEQKALGLKQKYPDIVFRFGGQAKEQRETGMDLVIILALGILLTYLIMAAQFESFLHPLVIMFSVPFAFSGSFIALSLVGENFNVLAFLGIIMLVGIVVNNAIVLVDYVNLLRSRGMELTEALVETGKRRLRPILMTTITTLVGVLPLALARGEGFELWRPIGITMLGGLTLSSLVTLVLIPAMYEGIEKRLSKKRTK
jgi:HAE1 family hydrophobic/amphiphilic exporter-1